MKQAMSALPKAERDSLEEQFRGQIADTDNGKTGKRRRGQSENEAKEFVFKLLDEISALNIWLPFNMPEKVRDPPSLADAEATERKLREGQANDHLD